MKEVKVSQGMNVMTKKRSPTLEKVATDLDQRKAVGRQWHFGNNDL